MECTKILFNFNNTQSTNCEAIIQTKHNRSFTKNVHVKCQIQHTHKIFAPPHTTDFTPLKKWRINACMCLRFWSSISQILGSVDIIKLDLSGPYFIIVENIDSTNYYSVLEPQKIQKITKIRRTQCATFSTEWDLWAAMSITSFFRKGELEHKKKLLSSIKRLKNI